MNPKSRQFDLSEQKIFGKLDQFCKRCQKLIDMLTTSLQFTALRNNMVEGMEPLMAQFTTLVENFQKKPYDLLDYTRLIQP